MSEPTLLESVSKTLLRRDLLPPDGRVIVGVSGGTDSLALLHILNTLRVRLSFHLHVATLDHGLRGDAGADDARFVAETARAWELPVTAGFADVRALAQQHQIGIEAAARLARYEFLAGVAHDFRATHIAVAHHADDQVETILLHLLRGSGLTGLGGMAYISPLTGRSDLFLIRPLLDVPRANLDAYCRDHGLHPRRDASNDDSTYTRNRLRHETIPYLRDVSPQVERNLLQLADIAQLEDDFADFSLHQVIDSHVQHSADRIGLPRSLFNDLHPALQRRFVLWAARTIATAEDVGYTHVAAAVELAHRAEVGARAQLPGGIQLRIDYEAIVVELDELSISDDVPTLAADASISLNIPGRTFLTANWFLRAGLKPFPNSDRIAIAEGTSVSLRARQPGDRFAPLGLDGHTQKVSKWMIDHKVPAHLRDRLPLLVVDDQIAAVWWEEWKVSESFAVTPASSRIIHLRFHKKLGSG